MSVNDYTTLLSACSSKRKGEAQAPSLRFADSTESNRNRTEARDSSCKLITELNGVPGIILRVKNPARKTSPKGQSRIVKINRKEHRYSFRCFGLEEQNHPQHYWIVKMCR